MKILPNGIAIIESDTHISRWVQESGRLDHDQNALPLILEHIPKGGIVVDVGAFIGDHTLAYARKVGHFGRVYAFEPNPPAYGCLKHNLRDCSWVTCFNAALGAAQGTVGIAVNANMGASHLSAQGTIPLRRLDDLLELEYGLSFVKIDAEGYEAAVLRGATESIKRCRPIMYIEVNAGALARQGYSESELLDLISSLGYTIAEVGGKRGDPQYDVFCYPSR